MGFFSDLWNNMVLREQTTTDKGYTSAIERTDLLGAAGTVKNKLGLLVLQFLTTLLLMWFRREITS